MQTTPEMIREQRFKVKLSGFDKEEVINFMLSIADDMETLLEANNLLKDGMEALKSKQKDLEDLFLSAKRFSDERLEQARTQAQHIEQEASQKAASIEEDAKRKAQEIVEESTKTAEIAARDALKIKEETQQQAREMLLDAEKTKFTIEKDLIELKTKRSSLLAELKTTLDSYQSWIREMVDVDSQ